MEKHEVSGNSFENVPDIQPTSKETTDETIDHKKRYSVIVSQIENSEIGDDYKRMLDEYIKDKGEPTFVAAYKDYLGDGEITDVPLSILLEKAAEVALMEYPEGQKKIDDGVFSMTEFMIDGVADAVLQYAHHSPKFPNYGELLKKWHKVGKEIREKS